MLRPSSGWFGGNALDHIVTVSCSTYCSIDISIETLGKIQQTKNKMMDRGTERELASIRFSAIHYDLDLLEFWSWPDQETSYRSSLIMKLNNYAAFDYVSSEPFENFSPI